MSGPVRKPRTGKKASRAATKRKAEEEQPCELTLPIFNCHDLNLL